tara:strand:+ start:808 stop:1113 length:306 start_codon:yes stop_codon:yes gene_type:complete
MPKINPSLYSPPNVNYWGDRCCKAEAEIERLRAALLKIRDGAYDKNDLRQDGEFPEMVWEAVARRAIAYQQCSERNDPAGCCKGLSGEACANVPRGECERD